MNDGLQGIFVFLQGAIEQIFPWAAIATIGMIAIVAIGLFIFWLTRKR